MLKRLTIQKVIGNKDRLGKGCALIFSLNFWYLSAPSPGVGRRLRGSGGDHARSEPGSHSDGRSSFALGSAVCSAMPREKSLTVVLPMNSSGQEQVSRALQVGFSAGSNQRHGAQVHSGVTPVSCSICFVTDPELAQTEQANACRFLRCSTQLRSRRSTCLESRAEFETATGS